MSIDKLAYSIIPVKLHPTNGPYWDQDVSISVNNNLMGLHRAHISTYTKRSRYYTRKTTQLDRPQQSNLRSSNLNNSNVHLPLWSGAYLRDWVFPVGAEMVTFRADKNTKIEGCQVHSWDAATDNIYEVLDEGNRRSLTLKQANNGNVNAAVFPLSARQNFSHPAVSGIIIKPTERAASGEFLTQDDFSHCVKVNIIMGMA